MAKTDQKDLIGNIIWKNIPDDIARILLTLKNELGYINTGNSAVGHCISAYHPNLDRIKELEKELREKGEAIDAFIISMDSLFELLERKRDTDQKLNELLDLRLAK